MVEYVMGLVIPVKDTGVADGKEESLDIIQQ
jgi:hypothetical protein